MGNGLGSQPLARIQERFIVKQTSSVMLNALFIINMMRTSIALFVRRERTCQIIEEELFRHVQDATISWRR
jgi:hypothetical protein